MDDRLDKLDWQIIDELRHDGRQANTEMARKLGVTETKIRNRIRKLVGEGVIQVVARVNLSRLGNDIRVHIGVVCDGGAGTDLAEVASRLTAMPEVRFVSFVTGTYDLLISASFHSRDDLFTFLVERLRKIPGITKTETIHQLRVAKRDYDYW